MKMFSNRVSPERGEKSKLLIDVEWRGGGGGRGGEKREAIFLTSRRQAAGREGSDGMILKKWGV